MAERIKVVRSVSLLWPAAEVGGPVVGYAYASVGGGRWVIPRVTRHSPVEGGVARHVLDNAWERVG
ncbi:MAG: hypothetical protein AMXMBFR4_00950 [Candidatus Hydrogenedentota bacterium]